MSIFNRKDVVGPRSQPDGAIQTVTKGAPAQPEAVAGDPGKLRGNLGAISIIFTVLAFNAPLAVAGGFVPVVIGAGNQQGAPLTFVVVAVVLLLFSVGLLAMSRFMHSCGAFYSIYRGWTRSHPGIGWRLHRDRGLHRILLL